MTTIAFFNNKGDVGTTSLVYHLAWMFQELGLRVLALDLDPQANLTSLFLDEERSLAILDRDPVPPILRGMDDTVCPHIEKIHYGVHLIPADLRLSNSEDKLSQAWPLCRNRDEAACRVTTLFYRAALSASESVNAEVVLLDVGPNLTAINRSALISSDYVVTPLVSDFFSLQGLRNLGPQLLHWKKAWHNLKAENPASPLILPAGNITPVGYVVLQQAFRADRPAKAYLHWMEKIPAQYRQSVLNEQPKANLDVTNDPECLAILKQYRSLMPLAIESRKPIFFLKPADGAIGAHVEAVRDCFRDFKLLATRIAAKCSIPVPHRSLTSF